jgi:hypothetical protein
MTIPTSSDKFFPNGSRWLRADFHLHTQADKEFIHTGDENYYLSNFVDNLKRARIELGVITNHNKFDLAEYKALRKTARKKGIFLLPGVELSVNDGANGIHTLIVFHDDWLANGQDYINQFLHVAFSGKTPAPKTRSALLKKKDPLAKSGPVIGLRSVPEIKARIAALREDAATAPISGGEVELIDAVLAVRETSPFALEQLRDIAVDLPAIGAAVGRMQERLDALDARGIPIGQLEFDASYGRTLMEYYDGFVFGFYAATRPDLPAVSSGGRYDALTRQLGQGAEIPAVGGVMRPGLILELEAAT